MTHEKYLERQDKARQEAIEFQTDIAPNSNLSYAELLEWEAYFRRLARRLGLTKEFKENGVL